MAELVTLLLLPQNEQQVFLPVPLQIARDLFFACPDAKVTLCGQFMWVTFACQNVLNDCLSGYSTDIAQDIRQLDIHLR